MNLLRGDLVTVAARGPYTGKPRPALIVQASETLPYRDSVTICLLTTHLIDAPLFRVRVQPSPQNGLTAPSDVMADKIVTVPRKLVGTKVLGHLAAAELRRVDAALRLWLSL